jgi:hypothetical protein
MNRSQLIAGAISARWDLALIFPLLVIATMTDAVAQQAASRRPQVRATENDSEALWTVKFAHCDYGFYVLLPDKFVGHSNKSSNPIHGFLIGLPDPSTTSPVTVVDERFIGVIADYDSAELASLDKAADWIVSSSKEKPGFKTLAKDSIQLNGRAAKRVKFEYGGSKGKFIEERIIALRAGILYQICLRTTRINYTSDELPFQKIADNFRWWKIHSCP